MLESFAQFGSELTESFSSKWRDLSCTYVETLKSFEPILWSLSSDKDPDGQHMWMRDISVMKRWGKEMSCSYWHQTRAYISPLKEDILQHKSSSNQLKQDNSRLRGSTNHILELFLENWLTKSLIINYDYI